MYDVPDSRDHDSLYHDVSCSDGYDNDDDDRYGNDVDDVTYGENVEQYDDIQHESPFVNNMNVDSPHNVISKVDEGHVETVTWEQNKPPRFHLQFVVRHFLQSHFMSLPHQAMWLHLRKTKCTQVKKSLKRSRAFMQSRIIMISGWKNMTMRDLILHVLIIIVHWNFVQPWYPEMHYGQLECMS